MIYRVWNKGDRVKQRSLPAGVEADLLNPEHWIYGVVLVSTTKRAYVDFSDSVNLPSYRAWLNHKELQEDAR